ncbi:MAG: radical SAM protein, partial [Desulfuromonadaceae bacterium]
MSLGGGAISWQKIRKACGHFFSRDGRNFIRRYLCHELAVPLFRLQARFSRGVLPLPAGICIEITNRCNLNCLMCVRRFWDAAANPLGEMSYELFQRHILPHLKPYQSVNLQGVGESLLSRNFLPMLRACKERGCETTFITNGVSLQKYAEEIVAIGVDEIRLSVDGTAAMQNIRKFSIDRVMAALDALNAVKERQGRARPAVYINYVLTRDTLPELPELIELVRDRGVTKIFVMHLIIHDRALIEQSVVPHYAEAKTVFARAAARAR